MNEKDSSKNHSVYGINEKITKTFHLPPSVTLGSTLVYIIGKEELLIENYKSIETYSDQCVCVKSKHYQLTVSGSNLTIEYFSQTDMKIRGCFTKIEFIR